MNHEWHEETDGYRDLMSNRMTGYENISTCHQSSHLHPPPLTPLISVPVSILFIPLFSLSLVILSGSVPFSLSAFSVLFPSILVMFPFFWALFSPAPSCTLTCMLPCLRCVLTPPLWLVSVASPVSPPVRLLITVCLSIFLVPASLPVWRLLLPPLDLLFLLPFLLTLFFSVFFLSAFAVWVWWTGEKKDTSLLTHS